MPLTDVDLVRTLHRKLLRLERDAARTRTARDSAIRAAVAGGASQAALKELTGLSRQAIQKIATRQPTGDSE